MEKGKEMVKPCVPKMEKNTKKEDMGCDFDCKNCPFPPCSKEEIERMKKKRNE